MISCTMIYVDPTEALMGQARKSSLKRILMELLDNMRGQNSPNIIVKTKDTKLALIGVFVWV